MSTKFVTRGRGLGRGPEEGREEGQEEVEELGKLPIDNHICSNLRRLPNIHMRADNILERRMKRADSGLRSANPEVEKARGTGGSRDWTACEHVDFICYGTFMGCRS